MPAEPPTGVSSTTTVPPTWTSPRLPRMCGGSPPQPALHGSLHVQACDFASVPFRPQVTPGALNISYRTSTAKAREGLTPPRQRNCQAYTHLQVPQAEPDGSDPGSDPGERGFGLAEVTRKGAERGDFVDRRASSASRRRSPVTLASGTRRSRPRARQSHGLQCRVSCTVRYNSASAHPSGRRSQRIAWIGPRRARCSAGDTSRRNHSSRGST